MLRHFKEYGRKDGGKPWCWDDAYAIRRSDGASLKVCKRLWFAIVGITRGVAEHVQEQIRDGMVAEHLVAEEDLQKDVNIRDTFEHFGIEMDTYHSYIQSFCVLSAIPETSGPAIIACAWMADYFELVGEAQPGILKIHYDPVSKQEIFESYLNDAAVVGLCPTMLKYPQFCKLMRDVFPYCVPREWKSVAGKCHICETLRNSMRQAMLRSDRLVIKRLRLYHRNRTMGEKVKYYGRINEAIIPTLI